MMGNDSAISNITVILPSTIGPQANAEFFVHLFTNSTWVGNLGLFISCSQGATQVCLFNCYLCFLFMLIYIYLCLLLLFMFVRNIHFFFVCFKTNNKLVFGMGIQFLPPRPSLSTSPSSISRQIAINSTTLITFTVSNSGQAPSGELRVVLPGFLNSLVSYPAGQNITNIEVGQSVDFQFALSVPHNQSVS